VVQTRLEWISLCSQGDSSVTRSGLHCVATYKWFPKKVAWSMMSLNGSRWGSLECMISLNDSWWLPCFQTGAAVSYDKDFEPSRCFLSLQWPVIRLSYISPSWQMIWHRRSHSRPAMNERSAILCSGHVCVFRTTMLKVPPQGHRGSSSPLTRIGCLTAGTHLVLDQ
jgi:hypothetical protein